MLRALGFLAAVDGRPQEGRDYLERAHEASPRDDVALQLLSTVCYQLGDIDSAVRFGERLLAVNPWRAADHARLSEVLLKQGELDRAVEQAEEALKLDPTLNPARNWIVQAYRQAGDDEAANRHADILRRINAAK
jgi:tetratricopeptide (TPR) repeat protein